MWKKSSRAFSNTSEQFAKLHNGDKEISTPRIGGVIIWISVILTAVLIYLISLIFPTETAQKMNFLSRNQTLIPFATLILAALIGLADDLLQIFGKGNYAKDPLIYRKIKIICVIIIGFLISLWFYYKLEFTSVHVPFVGDINLHLWFIPFFIITMLGVFSSSVIDGMDGLSGGVLTIIFGAYAIIAFVHNQIDIAAFCSVISGGTLAFLWFNIPPARFYMGETGMLALTITLSVIAFLTNSALLLLVIGIPLVATSLSDVIQITSYKFFNKKRVFKVAPLHHHFEALGWSREKVVMRYWILGMIFAVIGVIIALVG
jgi:phospho-N-acetylmuramoyl-pentapeptide-transferase